MKEQEYEVKSLLNEVEFNSVINKYRSKKVKQINFYLESQEDIFKKNKSVLRIRKTNRNYRLTLKQKTNDGAVEYHRKLSQVDYNKIIKNKRINLVDYNFNFNNKINKINTITNLKIIKIKTIRYKTSYNNCLVFLDHTFFINKVDFELEVEANSLKTADITLIKFCQENKINIKKSNPKIARFFQYIN